MSSYTYTNFRYSGKQPAPLDKQSKRSRIVLFIFIALFLVLLVRAFYILLCNGHFLQNQGEARFCRELTLHATRGVITDRNGALLAVSARVESIWASPSSMEKVSHQQLKRLAHLLNILPSTIQAKLADKKREFVYIKRHIAPELANRVMQLGIPGIASQVEYRRFYPTGELFAHAVGFTGVDKIGQEGLELAYNDKLAGQNGKRVVLKDRLGHIVDDLTDVTLPKNGQKLILSMDQKLQYLAYRELRRGVVENKAKSGSVVVLDAQTGEILAMANYPSYNPNNRQTTRSLQWRNSAITDLTEPGSTIKPILVSKAIDSGKVTPHTVLNTNSYTINGAVVRDVKTHRSLDVANIVQKSSNVGVSKLALMFSSREMWHFYHTVGFGRSLDSGFPGESAGRLRNPVNWRPIEQATMSFGYGVAASLLQMARAYTIFTTSGKLMPVSFAKVSMPAEGEQVIANSTARQMRQMLTIVGQPSIQISGYHVAGKSGTVRKLENGVYQPNKHASLFIGFAPALSKPRFIVAVMIDEPHAGFYYGTTVAGPIFSRIMNGCLRSFDVAPDMSINNLLTVAD
ncbi:MAG: penicillin-binding protein 2 [Neisseriales bacterium]|nr:MAG: penicillin-binding protein 2 [Neisseriales bacterium]